MTFIRLRTKCIIGFTILNLLIGMALFFLIRFEVHHRLEQEIHKRGATIARHLAESSVTPILTENTISLQLLVNNYVKTEDDLRYIYILNARNEVLAHSFGTAFPKDLLKADEPASGANKDRVKVTKLRSEEGLLYDMPAGIQQGQLGQVHVGISEAAVTKTLDGVLTHLLFYMAGIICFGTIMAVVFATAITRPIAILAAGVKQVGMGELDYVTKINTHDEIGELAGSFNSMLENLRQTTVSRQYMDKIINTMNDALIVFSQEGVVYNVNRAFGELFGYVPEEMIGCRVVDFPKQEAPRCLYAAFENAFQSGYLSHEGTCLCASGKFIPVLFSLAMMHDEQGKPQEIIGVVNDISGIKKAQEELEKKRAELENLNRTLEEMVSLRTAELAVTNEGLRAEVINSKLIAAELKIARDAAEAASVAKSEFLTNMSHEMRTPLNSIIVGVEFLGEADLGRDQSRCLEMIGQAGKNMLVLINDLIDLARIESGRLEIVAEEFNLPEMLDKTVELLSRSARIKGLELLLDTASDLPVIVVGDRIRLQQVLVNLVSNAVKFTLQGRVEISARPGPRVDNTIPITFVVLDTGIGIDEEKLQTIFETFTQADSSITRRFGGSGLGLTISRRLVEAMSGNMQVESTPGVGSSFYVTVPLSEPAAISINRDGQNANGCRNGQDFAKNIDTVLPVVLLVDDSRENRELLRLLLLKKQLLIDEAGNGHEAVEMFRENEYDLVLMDIQMPIMDGYTATRQIRQMEELAGRAKTPIVALTAHAYENDVQACKEAGCDDHISKPFKKAALFDCLTKYLNGA
ncbi:MAG TPA: response regulator [Desulfuromonadaceae bacterium]|jgi:PAS domain S-box-containing protein